MPQNNKHAVLGLRDMGAGAYVLRFERHNLNFRAGQYIHVGPLPGLDRREYSVYSSPDDDYLEILVKEIPDGDVSPRLKQLKEGDHVDVEGPFGFFSIEEGIESDPLLFMATGTGISPFRSMVRQRPNLNYRLIHGIRTADESYGYQEFASGRLVSCRSRQPGGDFDGRITDWLRGNPVLPDSHRVFLCGNCDMIYEVYDILGSQGLSAERIHAEVYF